MPWITACIGGIIGIIIGSSEREASFIAGICAPGGYLIGELIKFIMKRSAEKSVRSKSPEEG